MLIIMVILLIYENGELTYKEAEIEETYSFEQKFESEWTNS